MIPAVRDHTLPPGARNVDDKPRVICQNCKSETDVRLVGEKAICRRCSNVWSWKKPALIRGQRAGR